MILTEVAVFADSVGVVRSKVVRTLFCQFLASSGVVAVLAHAFSIKWLIFMLALVD